MIDLISLRNYLAATPFEPFRIYLSDGSFHDVPHPEFAWIIGNRMLVAEVVQGRSTPWIKEVAVLHVTRIEPLLSKPPGKRSAKKKAV